MTALVVIAKECVEGKVKTRLHPPLSLAEAADVARVSLAATLKAVSGVPATRRILFFDGEPDRVPAGAQSYELMRQPLGPLDERLAHVFDLLDEPTVLIGMDTPQVRAEHFCGVFERWPEKADALFGPAIDGGFWALGLRSPRGSLLRGVPMSRSDTGALQLARLHRARLTVQPLAVLRDIDTIDDLVAVAPAVSARWPAAVFGATDRTVSGALR